MKTAVFSQYTKVAKPVRQTHPQINCDKIDEEGLTPYQLEVHSIVELELRPLYQTCAMNENKQM